MKQFFTLLTFLLLFSLSGVAQDTVELVLESESTVPVDTIVPTKLYQYYFGDIDSLYYDNYILRRVRLNPNYYRMFVPLTYYNSPMKRITALNWKFPEPETIPEYSPELLPVDTLYYTRNDRMQKRIDNALLYVYLENPEYVVSYEDHIMSRTVLKVEDLPVKEPSKTPILKLFTPEKPEEKIVETELLIKKPNFWITGGNGSFQMSQNAVSDNWYQGGENNNTLMTNIKLFANYNDKNKIQFESSIEAKAGFTTVYSDTIRKYRINADLLRLYSKLGIQAASQWYYTISGEFNTQFFKNYKANTNELVSSFLAPANLIFSIGMDYKVNKKKLNLSVFLSPLAYSLRYVGNDDVDETKFGLEPGKDFLHDFGSKLQVNMSWKIIPSIAYDTRLYYFTSYEKVQAEWENSFNFVLNRYLSTKLFFHARYDDSVAPDKKGKSFFQFKEYLSFGINYSW